MSLPRSLAFGFVAAVAAAAAAAQSQTVVLTSVRDNTLYSDATGSLSNGAGDGMFAGVNASGLPRRALVLFDVAAAIPPGSIVTAASLQLTVTMTSPTTGSVTMHRVLADWGEGASVASQGGGGGGGPAAAGDATWLHSFWPNTSWTNQGGDFDPTASASTVVSGLGAHVFGSTPQLVTDVQSFLDTPATNFGWLLRTPETLSDRARKYATRESATVADRPVLTVVFTPPAATFATFGSGCSGSAGTPALAAQGGARPVLGGALALALTNLPSGAAAAVGVLGVSTTANATALGTYALPFDLAPFGMPGCTQLVSGDAVYVVPAAAGQAAWSLAIPSLAALAGFAFHVQGLVPDPAANALGATVTNAGTGVIGS